MESPQVTAFPTVAERVAAGVKVLDQYIPGWEDQIDLERLNVGHMERCVIGQLFGDFGVVYYPDLGNKHERKMSSGMRAALTGKSFDLGFGMRGGESEDELTAEWERVVLRKRRGKK